MTKWHIFRLIDDQHFCIHACLVRPSLTKTKLAEWLEQCVGLSADEVSCYTSHDARISEWEVVSKGDAVLAKNDNEIFFGFVDWHASVDAVGSSLCLSCIQKCELVADSSRRQTWKVTEHRCILATEHIQCAVIWAPVHIGHVVSLKPSR